MRKVKNYGSLPSFSEIGSVRCFKELPRDLTYPKIQPALHRKVEEILAGRKAAEEFWPVGTKEHEQSPVR